MEHKLIKRPWRKLVKKLQRKRKRKMLAQVRDTKQQEDELEKLKDPFYKSWLEHQQEIERLKLLAAENERQEQEEQWICRELLAQKQFQRDEQKRKMLDAKQDAERLQQEEELKKQEESMQKKRDEMKYQAEKIAKEFEDTINSMQQYLDNVDMKTPSKLEKYVESRPGEKLCEFFEKTNCCRFGPGCSFNHKRPMLAKIIVIRHFFHHPLLEQQEHQEYARGDANLELNDNDIRDSYDEFCEDVWPELESFGQIVNFRTIRNIQAHLRGHVFVEFADKRSALKAFTKLQSRYYASRRLNVEFSNIRHWRTGVCGLSLGRRCPKGLKCNFLHLMQNPNNKYNTPMDSPGRTPKIVLQSSKTRLQTPLLSWNNLECAEGKDIKTPRNWRWSESPEVELKLNDTPQHNQSNTKTPGVTKFKVESPYLTHHKIRRSKSPSKEKNTKSSLHKSRRSKSPSTRYDKLQRKHSKQETEEKSSHHRKSRQSKRSPSTEYKSKHRKLVRHHSSESRNTPDVTKSKAVSPYLERHKSHTWGSSERPEVELNLNNSPQNNQSITNSPGVTKSKVESPNLKRHKSRRSKSLSKEKISYSNHHKSRRSKSPSTKTGKSERDHSKQEEKSSIHHKSRRLKSPLTEHKSKHKKSMSRRSKSPSKEKSTNSNHH